MNTLIGVCLLIAGLSLAAQTRKSPPPRRTFDPAGTPYLTIDKDVAGKTLRYSPPGQPPVVIRQYPGRFGSITVQQGNAPARRLGDPEKK